MFTASLFARTQIYSTREQAEKEVACYLNKNQMANLQASISEIHGKLVSSFKENMQRENYAQAISFWNDYARMFLYYNSLYLVEIQEAKIDQPFI